MKRKVNMNTDFRPAYIKDFEACWKIIDQARRMMIASGRHQWTLEYPSEKDIEKDINNGNAYVLTVDDEVAVYGAVILNGEPKSMDNQWRLLCNSSLCHTHKIST